MAYTKLQVQKREVTGKNKVDKVRKSGWIPGVLYQKDEETVPVQVDARVFERVVDEVGTSSLIELAFEDGTTRTALIKDVQDHPYRQERLHVDFQGVRMDEAIRVLIPVVLLNREEIRLQPSVLTQMIDEVEIECLPGDLPQVAEVDVVNMQYDDVLYVKDLDIASNDKLTFLTDKEEVLCTLSEPQLQEEETEEETTAAGDVPVVGEEEEQEEE